jgi:hypothetical protein
MAKVQCMRQGWTLTTEPLFTDCLMVVPRGKRCPDIVDNALSAFFDGLQGIVYEDDKQINKCLFERQSGGGQWLVKMAFCLREDYDKGCGGLVLDND